VLSVSVHDLRAHVSRYLLTFLAVALGVAFVSGVNTLTDTITRTFDDLFTRAYEGTDVYVRGISQFDAGAPGLGAGVPRPSIDGNLVFEVGALPGVADVAGTVQGYAQLLDEEGRPSGGDALGGPTFGRNWVDVEDLNPFDLVAGGHPPSGPGEVVIDAAAADDAGYRVGDEAQVQTSDGVHDVIVTGIARYGGTEGTGAPSFVLFDEATAVELLGGGTGKVAGVGVVAAPGQDPLELRDRVASVVGGRAEVVTGDQLTEESQSSYRQNLAYVRTFLLVFALISVAVGGFVIYTSFSFIVAQQQRQVALLRALGASRTQVLASIAAEALIVGVLASAVGYALGVGLATVLTRVLVADGAARVAVLPGSAAVALAIGTLATIGSAFFPALRAARIPPVAAMRDVAVDVSYRSPRRLAAGALVAAPGAYALVRGALDHDVRWAAGGALAVFTAVIVLGPVLARPASVVLGALLPGVRGIVGRLAQQNAARNAKRTASTASALMIGLGVVTLVLVANASVRASIDELVDRQFRGDYVVDAGPAFSVGGLAPGVAHTIAGLPDVDAATGVRFGFAVIGGATATIGGLDTAAAPAVLDVGVVEGDLASLGVDGVAVAEDVARDHGLRVGDTIEVSFTDTGLRRLRVGAVLAAGDLTGDYVMDLEGFAANFPEIDDVQVWIATVEDVGAAEAEAAIGQVLAPFPAADLQDLQAYKDATKARFDPVLVLINVLLALTVLVAMVGIVNTMVLSIVERRREIGLMRAVGGLRSQVRAAVRWEALLISSFGLAAAVAVGTAFAWVLVRALAEQGFSVFAVPVRQLAAVTAVMLVLTLVASLVPAVWAGRRDILTAIAVD